MLSLVRLNSLNKYINNSTYHLNHNPKLAWFIEDFSFSTCSVPNIKHVLP